MLEIYLNLLLNIASPKHCQNYFKKYHSAEEKKKQLLNKFKLYIKLEYTYY